MPSLSPNQKVFVGMSGGVDSSVVAALLKRAGYDVTGVFLKVWSPPWMECPWPEERRDAMRAAARIGIPFLTFDFENAYKREVIDAMIREYRAGRTPNPDVLCNRHIKFDAFFKKARALGADFVATGHYVRLENGKLFAAKDTQKDQSYFLWTLTPEVLSHCLFPIGAYTKPRVRALARKFGLPTAEKKDSQGLCFLGKIDVKDFLKKYIPSERGAVLDETGETIGEHDGAAFFTLGERHGFRVVKKTSHDEPLYVVAKDMARNTITVSPDPRSPISAKSAFELQDVNWIKGETPESGIYLARVRYRQKLKTCRIFRSGVGVRVEFEEPQTAAAGQSLVLYRKSGELVGGGVIVSASVA